jgi:hypothetical protein
MSEFELAGIFDTYNRSLPASIRAYSLNRGSVQSKYGLTLIPTADFNKSKIDEMHVINPGSLSKADSGKLKTIALITYEHPDGQYIINIALERIQKDYGNKFQGLVKRSLDYN